MKEYFKRITTLPTKFELVFWWILRGLMIFAFIKGFFPAEGEEFDITNPLQVGANFLCMFIWEIFMLLPETNALRHVSPRVQTFLIIGIFCASFGGKFMNLYYSFRWWDVILHFVGGAACVFFGYEMVAAMQKRDKVAVPLSIALLCAMGFSFLAGTGWELFEFSFDEISCVNTLKTLGEAGIAKAGDAQHWNLAAALGTPKELTLIDPVFAVRWPIMDTMADIILNTLGALCAIIGLRIYPYRHKGKYNLNEMYKDNKVVNK